MLNATGKFGARAGNAAGVLALLFTVTERQLEDFEVDKLPGALNEWAAPLLGGRELFRSRRTARKFWRAVSKDLARKFPPQRKAHAVWFNPT